MILGVDYPPCGDSLLLFSYVPTIGSNSAAVPPTLLALIQFGAITSVLSASGYLAINIIIGSIIEPRMLGNGFGVSTLIVFITLILGLGFWSSWNGSICTANNDN